MKSMDTTQDEQPFDQEKAGRSRKKGFTVFAFLIILAGAGYGGYNYFYGSQFIKTDNAYTAAEIAQVTPAVGGIVSSVKVVDTQYVKKEDVLVVLQDTDATLALQQAEANYGLAKRKVRAYLANSEGLDALVLAREAEEVRANAQLSAAKADFERAQIDFTRRQDLVNSGSVSGEELSNAKTALAQAKANLSVAEATGKQAVANRLSTMGNRKANNVLIENSTVETNPEVRLAKARYEQAKIDLSRTVIRAPIGGIVAKRQVEIGQRIQVGSPLMTVVPVSKIHVDANFKEGELRKVSVGQKVEVSSDLYGEDVVYHGVVTGFSGGTGSAFSMIPAQNATGNWIKVVQRLPVRIEFDRSDLNAHPLQVGLSMVVSIDTESRVDQETILRYQTSAIENSLGEQPPCLLSQDDVTEKKNEQGI